MMMRSRYSRLTGLESSSFVEKKVEFGSGFECRWYAGVFFIKLFSMADFLVFLNLPPSIRYNVENLFMSTLFPGPNGPKNMDILFKPLVKELKKLYKGISVRNCVKPSHTILRGVLLFASCDLQARIKVTFIFL